MGVLMALTCGDDYMSVSPNSSCIHQICTAFHMSIISQYSVLFKKRKRERERRNYGEKIDMMEKQLSDIWTKSENFWAGAAAGYSIIYIPM